MIRELSLFASDKIISLLVLTVDSDDPVAFNSSHVRLRGLIELVQGNLSVLVIFHFLVDNLVKVVPRNPSRLGCRRHLGGRWCDLVARIKPRLDLIEIFISKKVIDFSTTDFVSIVLLLVSALILTKQLETSA